MADVILTDRSRIVTDQTCPRLRYYEYELEGRGIDLAGEAVGRDIGSCVHEGMEILLRGGSVAEAIAAAQAAREFVHLVEPDDQATVSALILTAKSVILPQLAVGWTVAGVESEELFDYPVGDRTVRLMSRLDLLATAGDTATLNGAPIAPGDWIWDWKCVKSGGDRWRNEQMYNMQWLSSLLGVERRFGRRMNGTIVVALCKADHPLVYTWRNRKTGETAYRYRYTCTEPHPFQYAKGGMCMGGVSHSLSKKDWESVPVCDLPGGQLAHWEKLQSEEPGLLAEGVDYAGPLMRVDDYQIERWLRQVMRREVEIAELRSPLPLADESLDRWFPQRTSNGNCTKFAKTFGGVMVGACPALGFCYGGDTAENYDFRVPNHDAEREAQNV